MKLLRNASQAASIAARLRDFYPEHSIGKYVREGMIKQFCQPTTRPHTTDSQ